MDVGVYVHLNACMHASDRMHNKELEKPTEHAGHGTEDHRKEKQNEVMISLPLLHL